jgi:hypothetical protein
MSKRGGADELRKPEPEWWPTMEWQTKAEYETGVANHNRIARSLIRLCDKYSWEEVLGVFSGGCEIIECEWDEREWLKRERLRA